MTRLKPDTARRFLASPYARFTSSVVVCLATLNLVAAVLIDLRTFLGPSTPGDETLFVGPFMLGFLMWGWAIWLLVAAQSASVGAKWWILSTPLPIVGALLACALFGVVAALSGLGDLTSGQPHYDAVTDTYTLNNHGDLQVIDEATYQAALAAGIRMFAAFPVVASAFGAGLALEHLVRARRSRAVAPIA
ncbi:hypothetical protein [Nocardioides sp. NPDC047086]|uniref:hypothetical protein n=1 Tax=Nocardioides sp. NPDC047086 TaxID=3154810 RepID=UPI0034011160